MLGKWYLVWTEKNVSMGTGKENREQVLDAATSEEEAGAEGVRVLEEIKKEAAHRWHPSSHPDYDGDYDTVRVSDTFIIYKIPL